MTKPCVWIAGAALVCAIGTASAEREDSEKAPSAGQIMHEREKACHGLRGSAKDQCLNDYVGPEDKHRYGRDSIYASKYGGVYRPKPSKPLTLPSKPGRSFARE